MEETIGSVEAQVLTSMAYDIDFGIHNHKSPASGNPLSPVAQHDSEEYHEYSGLYRAIERYERQEIATRFNISLTEYLNLPRDVIDMLTKVFYESARREEQIANQEEDKVQRASGKDQWRSLP